MRVLICEDTATIASLLQVYLMGWNLEFEVARDGQEALTRARQTPPDLVLSDIQMPVMDGYALCAAIRADPALQKVPVVLLTSLKDETARSRGRMVGASAFLTKPVALGELRKVISGILQLPNP